MSENCQACGVVEDMPNSKIERAAQALREDAANREKAMLDHFNKGLEAFKCGWAYDEFKRNGVLAERKLVFVAQ